MPQQRTEKRPAPTRARRAPTARAKPVPRTAPHAPAGQGRGKKPTAPVVRRDAPKPPKASKGKKGKPGRAGEIILQEAGTAKPGRLKLKQPSLQFNAARSKARFKEENYEDFFVAEIMAELAREATIFNDRIARWRCQCCDAVIPVPRRTEVYHGDYHLVHDDIEGLLINGEKFVPKAYTPIELVQPGRLRNPWTGKTIEGRDQGTTGPA
jgi:hypothetical protein